MIRFKLSCMFWGWHSGNCHEYLEAMSVSLLESFRCVRVTSVQWQSSNLSDPIVLAITKESKDSNILKIYQHISVFVSDSLVFFYTRLDYVSASKEQRELQCSVHWSVILFVFYGLLRWMTPANKEFVFLEQHLSMSIVPALIKCCEKYDKCDETIIV